VQSGDVLLQLEEDVQPDQEVDHESYVEFSGLINTQLVVESKEQ
jgi:hypothetical protein